MALNAYAPAASAAVRADGGTVPRPLSVMFWVEDGVPVQAPLVKNVYVTIPVGVNPATPLNVAVSYAAAPVASVPFHGDESAESFTTVPASAVA